MEITARYLGKCHVCDEKIQPGQKIWHKKGESSRHIKCLPDEIPVGAIRLSGGEGYGCRGWVKGQVVKNPQQSDSRHEKMAKVWDLCLNFPCPEDYRVECKLGQIVVGRGVGGSERVGEYEYLFIACRALGWPETPAVEEIDKLLMELDGTADADEPEYLFVLQTSSQYYREDGMTFGVGDESGRVFFATCRAATDEESASLREEESAKEKAKEKAKAFRELEKLFEGEGTYVATEEPILLKGEVVPVGEGQTPYGGGQWFVIEEESIWHVLNNGHDGDDWSRNNVSTGGAGAIGRRLPYSKGLEQQIRDLAPFG
jgi:hypothetical protein